MSTVERWCWAKVSEIEFTLFALENFMFLRQISLKRAKHGSRLDHYNRNDEDIKLKLLDMIEKGILIKTGKTLEGTSVLAMG